MTWEVYALRWAVDRTRRASQWFLGGSGGDPHDGERNRDEGQGAGGAAVHVTTSWTAGASVE